MPSRDADRDSATDTRQGDAHEDARTDIFSRDLSIPRDEERHEYQGRARTHRLRTSEIETLATVGAFRVVPDTDLPSVERAAGIRHLEAEGLIARHQIIINDRPATVSVLTKEGKQLLDGNRVAKPRERSQAFHAGLVKRREISHDAQLYRLYRLEANRIAGKGGKVRRVVLDHELKREYQTFINRSDRPANRNIDDDRAAFAEQASLPIVDGHLELPDLRIEYETPEGLVAYRDVELVTEHYSRSQLAGKAVAGFGLYRTAGCRPSGRHAKGATPLDPHHLDWLR